jgi:hypothetical protein
MDCFAIKIGEPIEPEGEFSVESPEDDREQLDMYLWRYCHERNRRIAILVGQEQVDLALDPDLRVILSGLLRDIRSLESGKKESLAFSERGADIYFVPEGNTIWCTAHRWGAKEKEPAVPCDREQVTGELRRFLRSITAEAVAGAYLTREQAYEFFPEWDS